jgi:hypothetical protein
VASVNPQAQAWYRKSLDSLLRAQSISKAYGRMNQREHRQRGAEKTSFE